VTGEEDSRDAMEKVTQYNNSGEDRGDGGKPIGESLQKSLHSRSAKKGFPPITWEALHFPRDVGRGGGDRTTRDADDA
jgi:hypothetical protein